MARLYAQTYYWFDLGLAVALPLALVALRRARRLRPLTWPLFWAGCLIGLAWEIPIFLAPNNPAHPFFIQGNWPIHRLTQPLAHASLDGGIFLVGLVLLRILCARPQLERFRWQEFGVLFAWGVGSAVLVEMSAAGAGWKYIPQSWNPELFGFRGSAITALPVAIWSVAPAVFYAVALRLAGQLRARLSNLVY